ncbi:hypothetical protein C8R45DRAFT_1189309 [Mycena sanguinolenta]|nr:hypothetical protein C8R45DRAFT_1189309 [Mycena sanguinolenta]
MSRLWTKRKSNTGNLDIPLTENLRSMLSTVSSRAADRGRIADIEGQILSLKGSIQALEAKKLRVQERLNSYAYPALTLPNEITSEIFTKFLPDYPCPPPLTGRLSPTTLTHICRKWREIALSTPALWRAISFPRHLRENARLRILQSWLRRSGCLPLSLKTEDINSGKVRGEELDALEYVTLAIDQSALHTFQAAMPLLRQLEVQVEYSGTVIPTQSREVPRLRAVTLWSPFYFTADFLPWAQLTSLTLVDQSFPICTSILQHTINLVHCHLAICSDHGLTEPVPDVRLPFLESLVLTEFLDNNDPHDEPVVGQYLKVLHTPALNTLVIPEVILHPDPLGVLRGFILHSGCHLQRLCVTGRVFLPEDVYPEAFLSIPTVSFNRTLWNYNAYSAKLAQGQHVVI